MKLPVIYIPAYDDGTIPACGGFDTRPVTFISPALHNVEYRNVVPCRECLSWHDNKPPTLRCSNQSGLREPNYDGSDYCPYGERADGGTG
jgi:hypothetical protein